MSAQVSSLINRSKAIKTALLCPTPCTFSLLKSIKKCVTTIPQIRPESLLYKTPSFLPHFHLLVIITHDMSIFILIWD